jgi:CHAT domain-containing protein
MIAPLLARADAQLALGSVSAAEHDLLRALELLDQQRGDIAQPVDRAVFLDARAGVFDRLVMLRIRAGRSDEALAFLERGRSSYTTERGTLWVRPGQTTGPAGQTVLNYALIGDTLLIWTIRGPTTSLTRRIVRRDLLVRRIEQVRTLLELGSDEDAARPALRALHAILVAPVEDDLGRANAPLVVVADGEIAGVPFAALWDPDARQYLVESHVIRFSPTLADAGRRSYPGAGAPARVLVVADPAFNRDAYPDLDRLAGALTEGRALVRQYPGASLLQGEAATPPALLAALPGAEMVHYGGHALFNDERPDQSQLVLAPVRGAPGPASLTADEISRLRLTRLRLVMLAACETLRSRSGRSGGFTGLSSAFLAAGAQGVVGSLWRVDDRATGELAARFYEAYPGTGDGAAALASAQRQMRRSHDPALRSPAAWAAFRYAGN